MNKVLARLYRIAEKEGIPINYIDILKNAACSRDENGNYYIFVKNRITLPSRLMEILAEELGHCVTQSLYQLCPKENYRLFKAAADKAEAKAKIWAIEHLVPLDELEVALESNPDNLPNVAFELSIKYELLLKAIEHYRTYSMLNENLWD